jgi:homoserine trans-succinylase
MQELNIHVLKNKIAKLETENKLLKLIVKNGKAYVNYHMTDCDGVHAQGSATCSSLEELYQWLDEIEDSIEGPFDWVVSDAPIEGKTYGHGWDIK